MRAEHRRHAHAALPRGVRFAARALRRQAARHDDPRVDRLRRVGRACGLDPRLPARPGRRLPRRRRRAAARAWGWTDAAPELQARCAPDSPARLAGAARAQSGVTTSRRDRLELDASDLAPSRRATVSSQRISSVGRVRPYWHQTSTVGPAPEIVAPSAPSLPRPRAISAERGYRWPGRADVGGRRGRRRSDPSQRWPGRAVSVAICARLRTASASGTSSGSAARAGRGPHRPVRDDEHRLQPGRHLDPPHIAARRRSRDHRAAPQRHCRGAPRARSRAPARRPSELEQVVGREQARDDAGGARPQAAAERDRRADPELEAVGGLQPLESADDRLSRSRRICRSVSRPRSAPVSSTSTSRMQAERGGQHVEARTEVRRRSRHPDPSAPTAAHRRTARSIALSSGSQGITPPTSTARCRDP